MSDEIDQKLREFQDFINYDFNNPKLLAQALTTPEYGKLNNQPNYEILETLGDIVAKLCLSLQLYENGIEDPGKLTQIKQVLESNRTYADIAKRMKIWKYVFYSNISNIEESSILAEIFEAIIGAVYLDSNKNITIVNDVIINRFFKKREDYLDESSDFNKNQLLEYLQNELRFTPTIKFDYVNFGPDHNLSWKAIKPKILDKNQKEIIALPDILESNICKTKKEAEKDICRKILEHLTGVSE